MIRVGWDLDGVHYDFGLSVWETLRQIGRVQGKMPKVTDWHFYRAPEWGSMTDSEFVNVCHMGVDMGIVFTYGGFHQKTIDLMNLFASAPYRTIIITDRSFGLPDASKNATLNLLQKHGAEYDEIYFTADKASIDLDYMIDDKVENFVALQDAGVKCYLLDHPWNRHIDAGPWRIDSVWQYCAIIERTENPMKALDWALDRRYLMH